MICLLTERRLHPGTFDRFREAWEPPDGHPAPLIRAYHLRAKEDEDHIISFGLFDVDRAGFDAMLADPDMVERQRARVAAMDEFVAEIGVDEIFEVLEIVHGPSAGADEDGALLA